MAAMVATEEMAEDHRVRSCLEEKEVLGPEVACLRVPVGGWGVGEARVVLVVEPRKPEVTGEWWMWMDQDFGKTGSNTQLVLTKRTVPTIPSASTAPAPRSPLLAAQCRE